MNPSFGDCLTNSPFLSNVNAYLVVPMKGPFLTHNASVPCVFKTSFRYGDLTCLSL